MDLYLIRHADALALGDAGVSDDADRPLSPDGEAQAKHLGKVLKKQGIALDRLYTSPLVRARQTAELMAAAWKRSDLTVELCDALEPGSRPRKLSRFLLKQEGERVGLVGHMPHLATFLGWLIGDKEVQIEMAKAGVAHLTCGEVPAKGQAAIRWLVEPAWYAE